MSDLYTIGFDLGGTKMLAGLLNNQNKIIGREKKKSGSQYGPKVVVKRIVDTIKELLSNNKMKEKQVSALGIAVPGAVDHENGIIGLAPNLGMENFPLVKELQDKFSFPIYLENDVNAGAYGEYAAGAAKGYDHVLGVFPGTGIGGGLILNKKLFRGANGSAGELGHMIIQLKGALCGCGQEGCVEALASRTAMAKDAAALAASGKLPEQLLKNGQELRSFKSSFFKEALIMGQKDVEQIVDRSAYYLGISIANTVNLLNPQLILLGGGIVEKLGNVYLRKVKQYTMAHSLQLCAKNLEFKKASLGDDAVLYGAAQLAREELSV